MAKKDMQLIDSQEIIFAPGENTFGLHLFRDTWRAISNKVYTYWRTERPDVVIVAAVTTGGDFITIEEFQPGVGAVYAHFVGGGLEEDDASPEDAALRELLQETGYTPGRIRLLSTMAHDSGNSHRKVHVFLAEQCTQLTEPKEEGIEVCLEPPAEFEKKFFDYLLTNPEATHGGDNTLKALTLAMRVMNNQ